jgi:hypothetical protein
MQALIDEAREQVDRIDELVSVGAITSGEYNNRQAWLIAENIATDGILTLPVYYLPKRDVLYLCFGGVVCTPRKPGVVASGAYQYEEIGNVDELSNQVRLMFDAPAGSVFDMWVVALTTEQLTAAQAAAQVATDKAAQTALDAQTSGEAATVASDAAMRSEDARGAAQGYAEDAQAAQVVSEAARDVAVAAKDDAVEAKNAAGESLGAALDAQHAAEVARDLAADSATAAAVSESNAGESATTAGNAAVAAQQFSQAADESATSAAADAEEIGEWLKTVATTYVRRDAVPEGETDTPTEGKRTLMQAITIDTLTPTSAIISGWSVDVENGGDPIETQLPLPAATSTQAGLMPAADHVQITTLTADVLALQQQGGKFIGESFATKAALDAYTFANTDNPGDFTFVEDDEAHSDATTRYIIGGTKDPDTREWTFGYVLESDPVSLATTDAPGLVKGSEADGQVFVEADGTMSVVGYDALKKAAEAPAVPTATAATATANGTAGTVALAASNNTTALNLAATPAGVAAQLNALTNTMTQTTVLAAALAAGTSFTVPQYVVGAKAGNTAGKRKLTVYLEGLPYSCTEIGTAGANSTSVTFSDALPAGVEIIAVSTV